MMERKYTGLRYEYLIIADFGNSYFEIQSKYIKAYKYSTITNLNFILSELSDHYTKNDEVEEIIWTIKNPNRLKKLWGKANEFFEDTGFIYFLEKELDKDRYYGGWNSQINF